MININLLIIRSFFRIIYDRDPNSEEERQLKLRLKDGFQAINPQPVQHHSQQHVNIKWWMNNLMNDFSLLSMIGTLGFTYQKQQFQKVKLDIRILRCKTMQN